MMNAKLKAACPSLHRLSFRAHRFFPPARRCSIFVSVRVIAGQYRGRVLKSPPSLQTRPTSDRLRETLFNVLAPRVEGARFLDLCAGTGAIGIEALSRGAAFVTFVERVHKMCALVE